MARFSITATCLWVLTCPLTTTVGADSSVEQVSENVRKNERIYENVELELRTTIEMAKEQIPHASRGEVKHSERKTRLVFQHGMYYREHSANSLAVFGEERRSHSRMGYDGLVLLSAVNVFSVYRNEDPLLSPPQTYRPHTILWSGATERLADFLFPAGGQTQERGKDLMEYTIEVQGAEAVDGVPCVKLRQFRWTRRLGENKGSLRYVWLAVDRNYLPAKTVEYRWFVSKDFPTTEARVIEWMEVKPGIWAPAKAEVKIYDELELMRSKRARLSQTVTHHYNKIRLNPSYPISLFRDIPIPEGAVVRELKDGRIP